MHPRTNSEKFLLVILAIVVLGGGSFFGYRWLVARQASLDLAYESLRADKAVAMVDLKESPLWQQRAAWIAANEPPIGNNEDDAKADVLTNVLKGARDHKLEIVEQSLGDVQNGPAGARVNVSVKVKGSMQDLIEWVTELQQPKSFYAVTLFSLKVDQDQKSMICTLKVARFFKTT